MILLDSNIVIYLRDPQFGQKIAKQISSERLHTCNIIVAEVLGYKYLDDTDAHYFGDLFMAMKNHDFNEMVTNKVIEIRQNIAIELPDAIVAATAIVNNLTLWTHNSEDFNKVPNLKVFDPINVV